jgi:flavin-binding protein dodecin
VAADHPRWSASDGAIDVPLKDWLTDLEGDTVLTSRVRADLPTVEVGQPETVVRGRAHEWRTVARERMRRSGYAAGQGPNAKGSSMADHIYSISEIVGSSTEGIDDAIRGAIARASKTLHNLDWFEVTDMRGRIESDGLCHFQVTLKVGFRLDERPA